MSEVKDGSFEAGLIEFRRTESLRGQRISQTDIAFVCGVSKQRIEQIERSALHKLAVAIRKDPLLKELLRGE